MFDNLTLSAFIGRCAFCLYQVTLKPWSIVVYTCMLMADRTSNVKTWNSNPNREIPEKKSIASAVKTT